MCRIYRYVNSKLTLHAVHIYKMSDTDGSDESDLVLEYFSSDSDYVFQGEGDEAGSGAEEEEDHVHGIQFGLYEPIAVEQVEDWASAEPDHVRIDEN